MRASLKAKLFHSASFSGFVVLSSAALAVSPAFAQSVWTGTGSADWFDSANWQDGTVPDSLDSVSIDTPLPNPVLISGGTASSLSVDIGVSNAAATGVVTVSGSSSRWEITNRLSVGTLASGTLTIQDGATIFNNQEGVLGRFEGGEGTVNVHGPGSAWAVNGDLYVGYNGSGALTIESGGAASSLAGVVGYFAGSTGTVAVTGQNSRWMIDDILQVGRAGSGELLIGDGGIIRSGYGSVGSVNTDAVGNAVVTGVGSAWIIDNVLYVGGSGTGELHISDGGVVSSGLATIGDISNARGLAIIDGINSRWDNAGALVVGGGGSATLVVRNGGTLRSDSLMLAQQGWGTGTLAIGADAGSPAAAPGTISTPTVAFGDGNGSIVFNHTANNYVFAPAISGNGTVNVLSGRTILTSANTYTGGTTVAGGNLGAAVTGALGSGPVHVVTGGGLAFTGGASAEKLAITLDSGSMTFRDNASAGASNIVNTQGGINFYNASTADSATIENYGGGIAFNDDASAGTASITAGTGAPVDFYDNATAGSATITGMAGSVVRFHGNSTADTATITSQAGSWVDISELTANGIGIGSLSGAGVISLGAKALTLGGLGQNDTISGAILDGGPSGDTGGSLIKTGSGMLTLTGFNSYTGGTTVAAGTLRIGDGGTRGSILGDVDIASTGTFAFDRSDNVAFAGALSGTGHIVKAGAGALAYDGDGSSFAGITDINAGALIIGSSIDHAAVVLGGSVKVGDGGLFGGHGTVGSGTGSEVTIASGGTVAPGNSIGTLTVNGDITFEAGSIYQAEINPALESDLIDASGKAMIEGGTVYATKVTGVYKPDSRWTIIGADGGVSGTFDTLDQNMPFVDLALAYDANHVYIDATRNAVSFCDVARTFNQCSTGNGLESTGDGHPVYDAVAALPDEETARYALDQLSGEIYASAKAALIEDSYFIRDAVNTRIRSAFGDASGAAMPVMAYGESGLRLTDSIGPVAWGYAFGSWGTFDSDGNAADMDTSIGGFLTGIDGEMVENVRLGLLAGYSHSSFHVDDRASSGSSDDWHIGLYGGGKWNALRLNGGLSYTWHDIEVGRSVAFPGFADSLSGDYNAGTFQIFGEAGYKIETSVVAFEPFANLAYVSLHTDSFTEKGGDAALHVRGETTDTTFTTLGVHLSSAFDIGGMATMAHGTLGWRHAFGDLAPLSTHAFTGGDLFDIAGVPIARDAALIKAGFDLSLTDATTLGLAWQGQFGNGVAQNGFKADFSVRF